MKECKYRLDLLKDYPKIIPNYTGHLTPMSFGSEAFTNPPWGLPRSHPKQYHKKKHNNDPKVSSIRQQDTHFSIKNKSQ